MKSKGKTIQEAADDLHEALRDFGLKVSEVILPIIDKTSKIIKKWKITKGSMK